MRHVRHQPPRRRSMFARLSKRDIPVLVRISGMAVQHRDHSAAGYYPLRMSFKAMTQARDLYGMTRLDWNPRGATLDREFIPPDRLDEPTSGLGTITVTNQP